MVDAVQHGVAWLMNRIRVNRVWEEGDALVKRRRAGAGVVLWVANRFLALAGSGCCMFVRAREWMEWEGYCAGLLYPERPGVKTGAGAAVRVPRVPGVSLRELLRRGDAEAAAFVAAAREVRRVHQIQCGRFGGGWSHGDLHLDNILYDKESGRAGLIDFDTRHEFGRDAVWRHGDDLKVMILELVGMPGEAWRGQVAAVIEEYGNAEVLGELARQLVVPRGLARVLWHTRTYGGGTRQVEERLEIVRGMIGR